MPDRRRVPPRIPSAPCRRPSVRRSPGSASRSKRPTMPGRSGLPGPAAPVGRRPRSSTTPRRRPSATRSETHPPSPPSRSAATWAPPAAPPPRPCASPGPFALDRVRPRWPLGPMRIPQHARQPQVHVAPGRVRGLVVHVAAAVRDRLAEDRPIESAELVRRGGYGDKEAGRPRQTGRGTGTPGAGRGGKRTFLRECRYRTSGATPSHVRRYGGKPSGN